MTIVALSGGVDSAVAALLLRDAGHDVQCLHMTNWEDDDGYCETAAGFQDARRVCLELGMPLHRVNFAREYRAQVFAQFLAEHRNGRTPNPDVLCNREIKFGVMRRYAQRLGARLVATGHYARSSRTDGRAQLLKGADAGKDQSYFLHAVAAGDLADTVFPLGELRKSEVRADCPRCGARDRREEGQHRHLLHRRAPVRRILGRYLPEEPGRIRDTDGRERGTASRTRLLHARPAPRPQHRRQRRRHGATLVRRRQRHERNELIVVQGHDHPLLFQNWLARNRRALDRCRAPGVGRRRRAALRRQDPLSPAGSGLRGHAHGGRASSRYGSTSRSAR